MDRSDFLRLSAAPLAAPLLSRGDAPEPAARLVYPDGRVVRWAEGTIDAEAALAWA